MTFEANLKSALVSGIDEAITFVEDLAVTELNAQLSALGLGSNVADDEDFKLGTTDPFTSDDNSQQALERSLDNRQSEPKIIQLGVVEINHALTVGVPAESEESCSSSYVAAANRSEAVDSDKESHTKSISLGKAIKVVGSNAVVGREITTNSSGAKDCAHSIEADLEPSDRVIDSAGRLAGCEFTSFGSGNDSEVSASFAKGSSTAISQDALDPSKGEKPESVEGDKGRTSVSGIEHEGVKTNDKPTASAVHSSASSAVDVGSKGCFAVDNVIAASISAGVPAIDALTAHLIPSVVVGRVAVDAAMTVTGIKGPKLVVNGLPGGISQISITSPSRGGNSFTFNFAHSSAFGFVFSGAQRGNAMGASAMGQMPTPVPTFGPMGGIRDGLFEPGAVEGPNGDSMAMIAREDIDLDLEDKVATFMIEQLKKGPEPKETVRILKQLNGYLYNNDYTEEKRSIKPSKWMEMIHRSLALLVRSIPIFDDKGPRSAKAIKKDAATVIGMMQTTFSTWESHFDVDLVDEQLVHEFEEVDGEDFEETVVGHLDFGLRKRIPALAKQVLSKAHVDPSLGIAGEANLQWGLAVVCSKKESENKIKAAVDYLVGVNKSNKNAACKGIALLIKHSDMAKGRKSRGSLIKRWSELEVRELIKQVMMSDLWEVMGHRALRAHFEDDLEINRFLNEAVFDANYAKAIHDLNKIDIGKVSDEEFWNAVDGTGVEEIIMNNVLARMSNHNS